MPEIPLGFSFAEADDGFILRRKSDDGTATEIKMSEAELAGLKAAIDLWSDRRMSELQVDLDRVSRQSWFIPLHVRCCSRMLCRRGASLAIYDRASRALDLNSGNELIVLKALCSTVTTSSSSIFHVV